MLGRVGESARDSNGDGVLGGSGEGDRGPSGR